MSPDSSDGASLSQNETQNHINKKITIPKKVYTCRNSVLTDLMQVNHLQTVYNITVAIFTLLLANACLYYIASPKQFWHDTKIIIWASANISTFVVLWFTFNAFALGVFQAFKAWVQLRAVSKIFDIIFLMLYLNAIVFMFIGTTYTVLQTSPTVIANFAIMCEQVRIFMKVYSFVRESVPRVLQHKPKKDGDQRHSLYPGIKHFLYFLFIPALIYRDFYPRKEGAISRSFILHQVFKFLACIFITYCIFMRFIVDVFKGTGARSFTLPDAALIFAGCMVVGSMMMFLMFYGMLHSWLNIFAELLHFGDRQFYQDWWNSTSFTQYYRRWNTVVYDWLHAYVYIESHNLGLNRTVSFILVFFVSALVHEYIIALSMGFFYPVLMATYLTIGMILIFITKRRTSQFWNTFMWSMLFSGWGVVICLYATEWYARTNCYTSPDFLTRFFVPASWNASCHILLHERT